MDQVSFYASIGWTIYALAAGFDGQSGQGEGKSMGNSWENHGTMQVFYVFYIILHHFTMFVPLAAGCFNRFQDPAWPAAELPHVVRCVAD